MSCYICDDKTLSCIAKAFVEYGVFYSDDDGYFSDYDLKKVVIFEDDRANAIKNIGQSLLNCNANSVNIRYGEKKSYEFNYQDVEIDEGLVWGCIDCYIYQSGDSINFDESKTLDSLKELQKKIAKRLFKRLGMKVPWGYECHNSLSA